MLTTRFPGLRSYFIRSKYIRRVENCEEKISTLWDRPDVPLDTREWSFWRQFSALSLSNGDISAMVEECSIRELTCCCPTIGAVSAVEQLLVAHNPEGPSKFSGALSIRYLGGILELPSFWHNAGDANDYVVGKLCEKLLLILKDLGLESNVDETPCDYIGVDCLADNFLAGILGLRETQSGNDIANKNWYANLLQIVRLLRQPLVGDRLPDSWKRVFSAEFLILIPLIYQQVEVDIVVRTHGSSHDQSIPPKEFSDADEGELDGADAESEVGDDDKSIVLKEEDSADTDDEERAGKDDPGADSDASTKAVVGYVVNPNALDDDEDSDPNFELSTTELARLQLEKAAAAAEAEGAGPAADSDAST
ncbi:hypothetical protein B0H17DRAFT_1099617, partial [Mycena rosella]